MRRLIQTLCVLGALTASGHSHSLAQLEPRETTTELAQVSGEGGTALDYFGSSVSVSEDRILVGAPRSLGARGVVSSAYVFRRENHQWVQEQRLAADDGQLDDGFGCCVSLSAKRALVGAPSTRYVQQGSAYLFRHDGTRWIQEQKITASDGEVADGFGRSLSLDGHLLLIGAPGRHRAYVFRYQGGRWVEEQILR